MFAQHVALGRQTVLGMTRQEAIRNAARLHVLLINEWKTMFAQLVLLERPTLMVMTHLGQTPFALQASAPQTNES